MQVSISIRQTFNLKKITRKQEWNKRTNDKERHRYQNHTDNGVIQIAKWKTWKLFKAKSCTGFFTYFIFSFHLEQCIVGGLSRKQDEFPDISNIKQCWEVIHS